jgi:hypothetical protein
MNVTTEPGNAKDVIYGPKVKGSGVGLAHLIRDRRIRWARHIGEKYGNNFSVGEACGESAQKKIKNARRKKTEARLSAP